MLFVAILPIVSVFFIPSPVDYNLLPYLRHGLFALRVAGLVGMVRIVRVLWHWGLGGGFGHLLLFDVGVLMFF